MLNIGSITKTDCKKGVEMNIRLFCKLYDEAREYDNIDMYVMERGWQDWMEGQTAEEIKDILYDIYNLANADLKEMRTTHSFPMRSELCHVLGASERTVQDWELIPEKLRSYIKKLLAYAFFGEETNEYTKE